MTEEARGRTGLVLKGVQLLATVSDRVNLFPDKTIQTNRRIVVSSFCS